MSLELLWVWSKRRGFRGNQYENIKFQGGWGDELTGNLGLTIERIADILKMEVQIFLENPRKNGTNDAKQPTSWDISV